MDLSGLGINSALVIGIVALTEVIKKIDTKGKFKKFYILIPLILGVGASFLITNPLTVTSVITNAIIYAGVSGYTYKSGKLALKKEKKSASNEETSKKEVSI